MLARYLSCPWLPQCSNSKMGNNHRDSCLDDRRCGYLPASLRGDSMRERDGYRDVVADLREYFGKDHNLLTAKEVAKYCGRDPRTIARLYDIPKNGILIVQLARRMCQ